jgi:hypothetical protein
MSSDDPDILERDFERLRRDSILKQPGRRRLLNLWVPETRPGILSRRFAGTVALDANGTRRLLPVRLCE